MALKNSQIKQLKELAQEVLDDSDFGEQIAEYIEQSNIKINDETLSDEQNREQWEKAYNIVYDEISRLMQPEEKEICICAAVITEDGIIVQGHRHCDCIHTIRRMRKKPKSDSLSQGFITSKNRYVNRIQGYKLQVKAGIKSIDKKHPYLNGELYSEDLY